MVRVSCPNGPGEGEKLPRRVRFSPLASRPAHGQLSSNIKAGRRQSVDRGVDGLHSLHTAAEAYQKLKLIRRGGTRYRLS